MKNPIPAIHQAAGALMESTGDREIPRSYGDPAGEFWAVRRQAGLLDQSHRGRLALTGKDRADFLNGMATNQLITLKPGEGVYTAFTDAKARMIGDARVYVRPEALWLDLEGPNTGRIHSHLDKYILAADVVIEDLGEKLAMFSIYGPASTGILARAVESQTLPGREYMNGLFRLGKTEIVAARNDVSGELGFDLFLPWDEAAAVWQALVDIGKTEGLIPVGQEALDTLRIEAGIPRYGTDMDEHTFPMEAGLDDRAISYSKGCYIGQETIARVHAQGRVNRRLAGFEIQGDTPPAQGNPVWAESGPKTGDDKPAGTVTSACVSPSLGRVVGLAYLSHDRSKPGTEVFVNGKSARVVTLPFYRRSSA